MQQKYLLVCCIRRGFPKAVMFRVKLETGVGIHQPEAYDLCVCVRGSVCDVCAMGGLRGGGAGRSKRTFQKVKAA